MGLLDCNMTTFLLHSSQANEAHEKFHFVNRYACSTSVRWPRSCTASTSRLRHASPVDLKASFVPGAAKGDESYPKRGVA